MTFAENSSVINTWGTSEISSLPKTAVGDTLPCTVWHQNYTETTCWTSWLLLPKLHLTIRLHNATRKHLVLYPQDKQVQESQKRITISTLITQLPHSNYQHSRKFQSWSNKIRFSFFNQLNRKSWGMRLVDVIEHVSHKVSYFYCATTIMRRVANQGQTGSIFPWGKKYPAGYQPQGI